MVVPVAMQSSTSLAVAACLLLLGPSRVFAQSGDGGGASGIQPGELGSDPDSTSEAASGGADRGYVNLSHGATIAIAVVASIVVFFGITTAVLFYLAKKRQWKIKEGLRRSVRRVGSAVKAVATPLTPKKMTFSPVEKRRYQTEKDDTLRKANSALTKGSSRDGSRSGASSDHDLEKGLGVKVPDSSVTEHKRSMSEVSASGKQRPRPPKVAIPNSSIKIDSPKTPMWQKVFGR